MLELSAAAANIGISIAVVATLLVASVIKVTATAIRAIITIILNEVTMESCLPSSILRPDTTKALARQMPPLNSNKIPQGIF